MIRARRGAAAGDRTIRLGPVDLGPHWELALARLALARGTPYADTCGALLTHLEAGWRLIRPLVSESGVQGTDTHTEGTVSDDFRSLHPDTVRWHLAAFAEMEVVDSFRWLACTCAEYVSGADTGSTPTLDDLLAETERLARALYVLALAVSHPAVSEEYRSRISPPAAFGGWHAEFQARFLPFARLMESAARPAPGQG